MVTESDGWLVQSARTTAAAPWKEYNPTLVQVPPVRRRPLAVLPLVNTGHLFAKLGSAYGSNIATRPSTNHDHIKLLAHESFTQ
jgi:hypothetical protein